MNIFNIKYAPQGTISKSDSYVFEMAFILLYPHS